MSLDNLAIARVFAEIGDLLEIKGENPFKIRAYRNASETIAHAAERIAELSPAARLAIPGIGKGIAAPSSLKSSRRGLFGDKRDQLLAKYPPSALEMLRIPGPRSEDDRDRLIEPFPGGHARRSRAPVHARRKLRALPRMGAKLEEKSAAWK